MSQVLEKFAILGGTQRHVAEPWPSWLMLGDSPMQIDERLLKNVFFIGYDDNGTFRPVGTGFVACVKQEEGHHFLYAVTAEHVIVGLQQKIQRPPLIRVNDNLGNAQIVESSFDHWVFHPDPSIQTDVAAAPLAMQPAKLDIRVADSSIFVLDSNISSIGVTVGDEIYAIGLFKSHYGKAKNIPIVRVGNIAA